MVRIDDSGGRVKCWLSRDELAALERVAGATDWEREIAVGLMGRCGLRAHEVPGPGDDDLRWSDDGDCWLFAVRGKDTTGGAGKERDAWMPDTLADDIRKYTRERGLSSSEPWVDASPSTVRRWVYEAAAVLEGGDVPDADDLPDGVAVGSDRWGQVSSHDLRRSWATYHLVERGVDVRTMMAVGGWSDYSAIEPYLKEPTERRIGETLATV